MRLKISSRCTETVFGAFTPSRTWLPLTRKTVTVLRVKGNQVRLGVNAPKTVSVQREEIFHRIKRENTEPQPS